MVVPVVNLFFPCMSVRVAVDGGNTLLSNPIYAIEPTSDAPDARDGMGMDFYAQLSGGLQTVNVSVEIQGEAGEVVFRTKPEPVAFQSADRLAVVELRLPARGINFRKPGVYTAHLMCNHKSVGTFAFRVL